MVLTVRGRTFGVGAVCAGCWLAACGDCAMRATRFVAREGPVSVRVEAKARGACAGASETQSSRQRRAASRSLAGRRRRALASACEASGCRGVFGDKAINSPVAACSCRAEGRLGKASKLNRFLVNGESVRSARVPPLNQTEKTNRRVFPNPPRAGRDAVYANTQRRFFPNSSHAFSHTAVSVARA